MLGGMATPAGSFSIVSWNLYQCRHHEGGFNDPVPSLRALDADVLVLPEAWWYHRITDWTESMARSLGYELHQFVSDRPSHPRDVCPWRMVVLTRRPARRLPDLSLPSLPRSGPRVMVRVELESPRVTIAGTHLFGIHALRRNPRAWWRERRALRDATGANDVVAGDFNMWGPVVRFDAGSLRGAVRGRTYPAHRPHSQIDHILVTPRLEVLESSVLGDMGSDHRAVRAVLRAATPNLIT